MQKMALKTIAVTASLIVGVSLAACSSSSNGTTGSGGGGTGGNLCPKISTADINALLATPSTTVTETDFSTEYECDSGGLTIQLQTDDTDKTDYNTIANTDDDAGGAGHDVHPLTGVGDEAYWWSIDDTSGNGNEYAVPSISAHKGTATCVIQTDNDPSKYSMPYAKTAEFSIQETDAAAWAVKAGKVCTDFFAAAGS